MLQSGEPGENGLTLGDIGMLGVSEKFGESGVGSAEKLDPVAVGVAEVRAGV